MTTLERFFKKVAKQPRKKCWLWIGSKTSRGYGKMWVEGKLRMAHRISYELHRGPIPVGLFVCHKCDTPACVKPTHLFLGTAKDNTWDMIRKGRDNYRKPKPLQMLDDFKRSLREKGIV